MNTIISYTYDASGNRITKAVAKGTEPALITYYVRDASGIVMSVYDNSSAVTSPPPPGSLTQKEIHLYGSDRLGVYNVNVQMETNSRIYISMVGVTNTQAELITFTRGNKFFELKNHLQNVLVTISDKKIGVDNNSDGIIDYYNADVVTANDFYPGGMQMPGRKYNQANNNYRYGFNGQEKSDDVTAGNYTAEFWEYDSRTGRRWNTDPVILTGESPYLVNGGNPIFYTDPKGDFRNRFGAWLSKTFNRGSSIGKNKYGEWYVNRKIEDGEGKKGDGKGLLDEVVVANEHYYGKGRNAYSSAAESLIRDEEIKQDIFLKGDKSMYKIYDSEKEAGNAAATYLGLLLPNPILKSATVASNAGKGVGLSDDVASTFRFGKYSKTVLEQPTSLFRYYDDVNAFAPGRFMTNSVSKFKFLDRMTMAIRPKWNNMTKVAEWQFPAGSTLYTGKAAMQFPWIGGKTQYFVTQDILKTATQIK